MIHEGMVIFLESSLISHAHPGVPHTYDPEFFKKLNCLFRCIPSWSSPPLWLLAGKFGEHFDGLGEDISLLLLAQLADMLMGVAMKTARI